MKRTPNRPLGTGPKTTKTRGPLTDALLERVKEIIEKRSITQGDFAIAIDSTRQTVCEWFQERGRSGPSGEAVLRIQNWIALHAKAKKTQTKVPAL